MKANQAKRALETLIENAVPDLNELNADQAVTVMLDFYRDQRAEDCDLEADGDMLLYQWGTYDWGSGRFFEFDLTRQFITGSDVDDDDIWQLSLKFEFTPTDELLLLKDGNRWCYYPDQESTNEFESFIRSSAVYKTISQNRSATISLDYFNAG